MIVKIENLSHDFKGITKINEKVTFIPYTLPGEVIECKIIEEKKKFNNGKCLSIIEESDDREKVLCPYYGLCGGCNISHIKYSKSLDYKVNIVKDLFKRYSSIEITPSIIYDNNIYGYRNKISLKVKDGNLALVREESHDLINIDNCMLVNDNVKSVIEVFNTMDLSFVKSIVIKGYNDIMVIIDGDISKDLLIDKLRDNVKSIILNNNCVFGNNYITIDVDKYKYAVYPESFFQVNTLMIKKLYDKVKEYAGTGDNLLDLYCGTGTIGIYLSDNFNKVYGVELNSDAVRAANINKDFNNINNIIFEENSVSNFNSYKADTVVFDPPRSGLDKNTINNLINSNIKRVVYVSCNPMTLVRDINLLKDNYDLMDITLFDMFPNTKHVECACLLIQK